MNRDQFEGKWREFKGKVKEKWGKLSDDDIAQINGKWDQLSGKLQKKYGWAKDQADREINNWCASCCEHKNEQKPEERNLFGREQCGCENLKREGSKGTHEQKFGGEHGKKSHGKDEHKDKKRKAG